jgi:hypothetical protein
MNTGNIEKDETLETRIVKESPAKYRKLISGIPGLYAGSIKGMTN